MDSLFYALTQPLACSPLPGWDRGQSRSLASGEGKFSFTILS
jgi:hypothetical protein